MASMTEFYMTSVWLYKPKIVKRIIDDLVALGCEHAEFTYDGEYSWFKAICLEDHSYKIRQAFGKMTRKIEAEAFDEHEDDILNWDDTLILDFDTEWFTLLPPGCPSSYGTDESDASYSRPKPLATYAHSAVWNELDNNNEPYTIGDILNCKQFERIKEDLRVELFFGPAGKLIDIAGDCEESVHQARDRLRTLLTIKKLLACSPQTTNLLYAEGYADPPDQLEPGAAPVFDADIRYLANIDPKLPSSTLLDRATVEDLEGSYKTLYATASSIRLCLWNPDKNCRVSLLGPKVAFQDKARTVWGNRPPVATKEVSEVAYTSEEPTSFNPGQTPDAAGLVETWIKELPAQHEFAAGADTHALLGDQTPVRRSETAMSESLIDLTNEPATPSCGTPMETPPSKTLVDSTAAGDTRISPLCSGVSATPREELGMSIKGTVSGIHVGKGGNELAFTGDDCLIDLLAAVRTSSPMDSLQVSIQWEMPPLVPSPPRNESDEGTTGGLSQISSTKNDSPTEGEAPISRRRKDQRHSQQTTDLGKKIGPSRSGKPLESPPRGSRPSPSDQLESSGYRAATKQFTEEIETAIAKVLSLGPYRRGKVSLRAELGRAIFEAVDPSGLAFNSANSPSNGWKKPTLIKKLNKDYGENQNIHFTKILSTFGCAVGDMINAKASGIRLWEQEPNRSWTTYSFHCSLRSNNNEGRFIVDIEDDGTSKGNFSYSIRPHNDVFPPDQPTPIYVHAVQRNWDLQIALAHVETDKAEMEYGAFADALMQSLSISRQESGDSEIMFAVYNDSAVDVKEVRALTKWRHLSLNHKSALEITEVQRMELTPYSEGLYSGSWDSWTGRLARPWFHREAREKRAKGEFPLWYEAAVVSLGLEELFQQNLFLQVGEKVDWDPEDVKARGLLAATYGPALEMVKLMDHVGAENDNHLSAAYKKLLPRGNDSPPRRGAPMTPAPSQPEGFW
ncbi:hypothetical protein C8A05DRAFT_43054 [Staphylotrichum tortipilum]|uniref:DUF7905 domain-containing protein n=1 Tax=Staphylotrichum tortipilum TaxID=2831512 RepID=A0AAN6MPT2_9PEZI|nr:hypothetical protein C8A05DRAFT_43054 [Staphylotrichum longicolle]